MSSVVECPICFKNFSNSHIQFHVQSCNGNGNNNIIELPSKRKRLSINVANSPQTSKKSPWESFLKISKSQTVTKNVMSTSDYSEKNDENFKETANTSAEEFLKANKPLAETARPANLENYFGQSEVLGEGTALNKLLNSNAVPSMIFWGPPGCGKTTLANIIACKSKKSVGNLIRFVKMSATNSGKADVQAMIKIATNELKSFRRKTILFIDEIHRFNKLQQDTFLPHVENGTIVLLGATTENPSFALNSALLSRCRVIVMKKLEADDIKTMLVKAVKDHLPFCMIDSPNHSDSIRANLEKEVSDSSKLCIANNALEMLAKLCDGDARIALNGLQVAVQSILASQCGVKRKLLTKEHIKLSLQKSHILYDKTGDEHYNITSALHKSVRGCDENAALYWLTRMMLGGEDPKTIARRLIRMASEDIGLADTNALSVAVSAYHGCLFVGMPECDVILAQCVVYLARAPKSIEVYKALEAAKFSIKNHEGPLPDVPLHLRNASTKLMKDLGYGKDYDYTARKSEQAYLPEGLEDVNFFNNN